MRGAAAAHRAGIATATALALVLLAGMPGAAADDRDGDGLRDAFETRYGLTSPDQRDSDGDGVVDPAEDSDGDRLSDLAEQRLGTHPGKRDSDGDGTPDGKEDADGDGRSNAAEQDHRPVPAGLRPSLGTARQDVSPHKAGCQATHGSATVVTCSYGPASSARTVVLMGDSHAMQLVTPIKTVAEERGWRLTTLVKKACPPVLGIHNRAQRWLDDGASCRRWRRAALEWLRADPPDHIIMAHSDGYAISDFKGRAIKGGARPAAWRTGMKRTLAQLPARSRVILLGDIPTNRTDPVGCLRRHPQDMSRCVTSRQPLRKRAIELALADAARARGATFRRFYDKVCSYDPCPLVAGDVLIHRDRGHLTEVFARQLTPTFRRMLPPLIGGDR